MQVMHLSFESSRRLARRVLLVVLISGLSGCRVWAALFPPAPPAVDCVAANPRTAVRVQGTFRYGGHALDPSQGSLGGTISFQQADRVVRVTQVTYDFGEHRALVGSGRLDGNRLAVHMKLANGGQGYTADVVFIFGSGGRDFCVAYSDSNGDKGAMGSFTGIRIRTVKKPR